MPVDKENDWYSPDLSPVPSQVCFGETEILSCSLHLDTNWKHYIQPGIEDAAEQNEASCLSALSMVFPTQYNIPQTLPIPV